MKWIMDGDSMDKIFYQYFHLARHQIEKLGWGKRVRCGFIHVPSMAEQVKDDSVPSLPFAVIMDAIKLCIKK
jgi:pyrrolidone-carboxylate peptidase